MEENKKVDLVNMIINAKSMIKEKKRLEREILKLQEDYENTRLLLVKSNLDDLREVLKKMGRVSKPNESGVITVLLNDKNRSYGLRTIYDTIGKKYTYGVNIKTLDYDSDDNIKKVEVALKKTSISHITDTKPFPR